MDANACTQRLCAVMPDMTAPIKTAMVMAAGHGTRMGNLTQKTCKALVKVGGKALIDHTLDRLEAAGITRAIVNVHAFANQLEAHLKQRRGGPDIVISDERNALLETGGGLVKALPLLGTQPILICNIDAIWLEFAPVLPALMAHWDEEAMDDLLLLARTTEALGYGGKGDFDMDPHGRLTRRSGAHAPYVYAGVQIFKPELARGYKIEKFSRNLMWDKTLASGRISGFVLPGFWMHAGDPQAVRASNAVLAEAQRLG